MSSSTKRYVIVGALACGIFGAGLVVGLAGGSVATLVVLRNAVRQSSDPVMWPDIVMKSLTSELDLKEKQRQAIRPIVTSASDKVRDTYAFALLDSAKILRQTRLLIEEELTLEQKEKFEAFVESRKGRFKRFIGGQAARRFETDIEQTAQDESRVPTDDPVIDTVPSETSTDPVEPKFESAKEESETVPWK